MAGLPIELTRHKICPMTPANDSADLLIQLTELKIEHSDLDTSIARLEENPPHDQLLLRRMKKRKLQLKDRIATVERMIGPDLLA